MDAHLEADMSMEKQFLECKQVFCSPLTRAIQTATIALRPLLLKLNHRPDHDHAKIQIALELREKRNCCGFDSEGRRTGDAIKEKVKAWNRKKLNDAAEEYENIIDNIKCSDVKEKFGTEVESRRAVEERMDAFMNKLKACPNSCIICVGHSHFFRQCFQRYGRNNDSADARKFGSTILRNCGVVGVRVTFPEGSGPSIPAAEFGVPKLLFGTRLVERTESWAAAPAGPKSTLLAAVGACFALCVKKWGSHRFLSQVTLAGDLVLMFCFSLLLARAFQRWAFSEQPGMVTCLWIVCFLALFWGWGDISLSELVSAAREHRLR